MKLILPKYFSCFFIFQICFSDEIIQDSNGNYFLMKDDGTFVKFLNQNQETNI